MLGKQKQIRIESKKRNPFCPTERDADVSYELNPDDGVCLPVDVGEGEGVALVGEGGLLHIQEILGLGAPALTICWTSRIAGIHSGKVNL